MTPDEFNDMRDGAETAVLVSAAVETGLLRALVSGPSTAAEVAARLDLDERAVGIVLAALVPAGLVTVDNECFALTEVGRGQFADAASPEYMAGGLPHWLSVVRAFTRLPEAIREGGPVGDRLPGERARGHVARFMSAMASRNDEQVSRTVALVLGRRPRARAALDLGGGPGVYARAMRAAGVEHVTLYDQPETIDYVLEAYDLGSAPGIEAVRGDFMLDPLPAGPFDIVLLSNVVHIYEAEANAALLRRAAQVTAPGGVVAIGDFVRGRSPRAARFAVVMLLRTEGGNTYDEATYERWLRDSGFVDVQVDDLNDRAQLVTAVRAG
ncbi:MAG: methyltransferase [Gemmatimonadota bacterium]|jgi:SAM-dependent methyltransferase